MIIIRNQIVIKATYFLKPNSNKNHLLLRKNDILVGNTNGDIIYKTVLVNFFKIMLAC